MSLRAHASFHESRFSRRQVLGAAGGLILVPSVVAAAYASPQRQGDGAAATPANGAIEIGEYDLYFEPANLTFPANTDVSVTVTNNGQLPHNWDILTTDFKTEVAGNGDQQTITVNLPAGQYNFQCDVPGHAEAGMVGTLTVAEGGGTSGTPAVAGTPGATPGATPAAADTTSVQVGEYDLYFEPADINIPADTDVSVTVVNNGQLPHNWDVLTTDFKTEVAGNGDSQTITVNLPAGQYDIQCDVPGHAEAGMVGKLTVQ